MSTLYISNDYSDKKVIQILPLPLERSHSFQHHVPRRRLSLQTPWKFSLWRSCRWSNPLDGLSGIPHWQSSPFTYIGEGKNCVHDLQKYEPWKCMICSFPLHSPFGFLGFQHCSHLWIQSDKWTLNILNTPMDLILLDALRKAILNRHWSSSWKSRLNFVLIPLLSVFFFFNFVMFSFGLFS